MHWQEATTVEKTINFLSKEVNFKNFLYLNIGDEGFDNRPNGKEMRSAVTKLNHYLNKKPKNNLQYRIDNLDAETHATTPLIGFVKAYRALYKDWSLPESTFLAGLSSIEKHYFSLSEQFGYKISPQERVIYFAGYYQLEQNKNTIEAIKLFKYNIENNPSSSNAYDSLADAYEKKGKIKEALEQMELAIKFSSATHNNYN